MDYYLRCTICGGAFTNREEVDVYMSDDGVRDYEPLLQKLATSTHTEL